MKKKIYAIVSLICILVLAFGFTACKKVIKDTTELEHIKQCFAKTVEATKVTKSIEIKAGATKVYTSESSYVVDGDKVNVSIETNSLNEDITASELYVIDTDSYELSKADFEKDVPFGLSVNEADIETKEYKTGDADVLSFSLKESAEQVFLSLEDGEAEDISEVKATVTAQGEKVVSLAITYVTEQGNNVSITFNYLYE